MDDARSKLYTQYVSTFKENHRSVHTEPFPEAKWYEFSRERQYEYLYLPLLNDLSPDARILELGCGEGDMLTFLANNGFHNVTGIDVSGEQVAVARERGLHCEQVDAFAYLDAQDEPFEVVIAKDFLEHFTPEELLELTAQISSILTDDGRLIIQTPNGRGLFPGQVMYGDLTHKTILTPQSLRQLLQPYGFTQFQFKEVGPTPTYILGIPRMIGWELLKAAANLTRLIEQGKSQRIWTENMLCLCTK